MSDRSRFIVNVIHIMRALMSHRNGLSTGELAEKCNLDRRTVQRYISMMSAMFAISDESCFGDKRRKRYRIPPESALPRVVFGLEEIVALSFYRSLLPDTSDLPFHDELMGAFQKINLALKPALTMERIGKIFTCYTKNHKSYHLYRQTILTLTEVILMRQVIRVVYHAFQSDTVRIYRIDPHHMFFYDGGLYLSAYVHGVKEIWNFAVERIQNIEMLPDRIFELDSLETSRQRADAAFRIFSDEPFRSRFIFPAAMRPYAMERSWHPSQTISDREDGSVEIHFFAGGRYDLIRWALSFGTDIEVLEPDFLRRAVADELRRAASRYENDPVD